MSPIVLPTFLIVSFTFGLVTVLVTTGGGFLFPPSPPPKLTVVCFPPESVLDLE